MRFFGQRALQKIRRDKNMSLRALAEKTNVSKDTIRNIEGGVTEPSIGVLIDLCIGLGVDAKNFIGEWTKWSE